MQSVDQFLRMHRPSFKLFPGWKPLPVEASSGDAAPALIILLPKDFRLFVVGSGGLDTL